jgi:hypothetical protein
MPGNTPLSSVSYPDLEAGNILCPQMENHRFHTTMSATASARTHTNPAQRQIRIIQNHEDFFRFYFLVARQRSYGLTAQVHPSLGLAKANLALPIIGEGQTCLKAAFLAKHCFPPLCQ